MGMWLGTRTSVQSHLRSANRNCCSLAQILQAALVVLSSQLQQPKRRATWLLFVSVLLATEYSCAVYTGALQSSAAGCVC